MKLSNFIACRIQCHAQFWYFWDEANFSRVGSAHSSRLENGEHNVCAYAWHYKVDELLGNYGNRPLLMNSIADEF